MRNYKRFLFMAAVTLTVASCRTPKDVTYLQDFSNEQVMTVAPVKEITAQPGDRVAIFVHSKNSELADMFNLPRVMRRIGQTDTQTGTKTSGYNDGQTSSYVVDNFGDIEFPGLGVIHVGGMTRQQISEYIKNELISRNLLKDPTVSVEFIDHSVTVLGSVGNPGRIIFDRDRLNVLEAIGLAGDLTIDGVRTNVRVLRMENGKQKAYNIDLTDAKSLYSSPVFYLQQNDIIYVEPNDVKKRTTTANGNSPFTPAFWISIASLGTTIALLFVR